MSAYVPVRVIEDDFDRLQGFGKTLRCQSPTAHEGGQFAAEGGIQALYEPRDHVAAALRGSEAKAVVASYRDVDARTHEPTFAVRASPPVLLCRCGGPVASDNDAGFWAACVGQRSRDTAPGVPSDFWQTAQMAAALASGDLGHVVRVYRSHPFHGHPLPQSVMADWLNVSQSTLSRIELGKRRLTVDEIVGFARSLGLQLSLRWEAQHPTEVREDVEPISRRSLLGAGAGAAAAGESDRAAAEGMKALHIAKSTGSKIAVRERKRLDRQLVGRDMRAVADVREAFAAL